MFILHILHPSPVEIRYITAQCEKTDGKSGLLLLKVKVHKTVLNTGYTISGAAYCRTVAQFGRKHLPSLRTIIQHVLKYNTKFTFFLYLCVETYCMCECGNEPLSSTK